MNKFLIYRVRYKNYKTVKRNKEKKVKNGRVNSKSLSYTTNSGNKKSQSCRTTKKNMQIKFKKQKIHKSSKANQF